MGPESVGYELGLVGEIQGDPRSSPDLACHNDLFHKYGKKTLTCNYGGRRTSNYGVGVVGGLAGVPPARPTWKVALAL